MVIVAIDKKQTIKWHMCRKGEDMFSSYIIGQMSQLADALEESGFTPDDITKLGQFENLSDIRGLFCGTHELKRIKHIIDCDADPFCPERWEVVEHQKGGQLDWLSAKLELYLSEKQKGGGYNGHKLRKELANKPVLNANVLDYLLKNPNLIPENWKNKYMFFWGTIYRGSFGDLCVRYLYRGGYGWDWNDGWLDYDVDGGSPAVWLAS